ncbi:MAG: hypothetical protein OEZ68_19700 [Gammaproteobacteria bacterium]|nr:hypothetical protein [Gammaproteobacteria bacterium]MDH5803035.1 hypothetical protein [Gammaproteobacteria bacterium]
MDVQAGDHHTCALMDNNLVKCWGLNSSGQLGQEDTVYRGDDPGEMGDNLEAIQLGVGRTVTAVTAGTSHTCAILNGGDVKCWGSNGSGKLGLEISDTAKGRNVGDMGDNLGFVDLGGLPAIAIAAGGSHTCAILYDVNTDSNSLKCWGLNFRGQLGQDDTVDRGVLPGQMGIGLLPVFLGTGVEPVQVTTGGFASCAVLSDGFTQSAKCWGVQDVLGQGNGVGHIGSATGDMAGLLPIDFNGGAAQLFPQLVRMGNAHACAILTNGSVKCWGAGALGLPGVSIASVPAGEVIDLGVGRTATDLAVSDDATCALLDDTTVKCWGSNSSGALGRADGILPGDEPGEIEALNPIELGVASVAKISSYGAHHCVLLTDNTAKCWGDNANGYLGIRGTLNDYGTSPAQMGVNLPALDFGGESVLQIETGDSFSCAILAPGSVVRCWGSWRKGLGNDIAADVTDTVVAVNVNLGMPASSIALGFDHACAILSDGSVKCWGNNFYGQLGQNSTISYGDGLGGSNLMASMSAISLGAPAVKVSAGHGHTCAILNTGGLKCWGYNSSRQLGYADTTNRGDGGAGGLMAALPEVVLRAEPFTVLDVSASTMHTCAVVQVAAGNELLCWGGGSDFALGHGMASTAPVSVPPVDLGVGLGNVISVETSDRTHTCAQFDTGAVKCWGASNRGQTGNGQFKLMNTSSMGDALPLVRF